MGGASCRNAMVACAPNDGQTAVPFYAQRIPVQQRRALGFVRHARRRGHGRRRARIGVLPSFWWLVAAAAGAVALALVLRPAPRRGGGVVAVGAPPPALAAIGPPCRRRWFSRDTFASSCGSPLPSASPRRLPFARFADGASSPIRRRAASAAAAVAALVYLGAASSLWPRLPAGDEPHYLVIAQSLLRDHDLQIENNHTRGDYHEFFALPLEARLPAPRRQRADLLDSRPGPSRAGRSSLWRCSGIAASSCCWRCSCAAATGLAWTAIWRLTGRADASWFGWATVALTVPFVFEAFTAFPDGLGGSIVMAGVLVMLFGVTASERTLLCAGAALAVLPWLHTRFALPAGALGVIVAGRQLPSADRVRAGSPSSSSCRPSAAWPGSGSSTRSTGRRIPRRRTADTHKAKPDEHSARADRSAHRSSSSASCRCARVYLCALVGFVPPCRRAPREAGELALIILPYALVTAAYFMWWGGFSPPGRFLTTVLLPLSIPAGVWFANAGAARPARRLRRAAPQRRDDRDSCRGRSRPA